MQKLESTPPLSERMNNLEKRIELLKKLSGEKKRLRNKLDEMADRID